jgi:hypothetical protein
MLRKISDTRQLSPSMRAGRVLLLGSKTTGFPAMTKAMGAWRPQLPAKHSGKLTYRTKRLRKCFLSKYGHQSASCCVAMWASLVLPLCDVRLRLQPQRQRQQRKREREAEAERTMIMQTTTTMMHNAQCTMHNVHRKPKKTWGLWAIVDADVDHGEWQFGNMNMNWKLELSL